MQRQQTKPVALTFQKDVTRNMTLLKMLRKKSSVVTKKGPFGGGDCQAASEAGWYARRELSMTTRRP